MVKKKCDFTDDSFLTKKEMKESFENLTNPCNVTEFIFGINLHNELSSEKENIISGLGSFETIDLDEFLKEYFSKISYLDKDYFVGDNRGEKSDVLLDFKHSKSNTNGRTREVNIESF